MMMIVGLCAIIIIVVIGLALSIHYLLFSHSFLENDANQLATKLAVNLNYNDRIGQMNNVVANAHELLFNSRTTYERISSHCPQVSSLAEHLLSESREGADIVEKARKQLNVLILKDLETSAEGASGTLGKNVSLPWASSTPAQILDLKVGNIKGVESNVSAPIGNDDLLELDTKMGYIDPETNLYYGRCIMKLPGDPDKKFRLTSLAAPVEGSVAPPRLTEAKVFEKSADFWKDGQPTGNVCDQLPSAVQLRINMDVTNKVAVTSTQSSNAVSTAATSGAKPVPEDP
jgi:hypothetical protein